MGNAILVATYLVFLRWRLSWIFTLISHHSGSGAVIRASTKSRSNWTTLILFSLDKVIASIKTVQILKERFVHKDKILIHFQVLSSLFFKYYVIQFFIVYVIWRIFIPSEIINPPLNPFLINQIQNICVFFIRFELMICLQFSLSSQFWIHVYYLIVWFPFKKAFFELN